MNEPDQIIADMDALTAFSAAFIRSPDIDCLYQLMSRVRRQFRQLCVLSDLLNELFIQKIRKYAELTELTPYAAHELIKAIYIGAPDKSSGKRRQSIHICYDMIGFLPLCELMTQKMA